MADMARSLYDKETFAIRTCCGPRKTELFLSSYFYFCLISVMLRFDLFDKVLQTLLASESDLDSLVYLMVL